MLLWLICLLIGCAVLLGTLVAALQVATTRLTDSRDPEDHVSHGRPRW